MGIGNYCLPDADTVYIDRVGVYGEHDRAGIEDEDDYSMRFEDMVAHLLSLLPRSDYPVQDEWRGDHTLVIARNAFYKIGIAEWQTYFSLSVILTPWDDYAEGFHPLAVAHLNQASTAIFTRVHAYYQLSVWSSAGTTTPWCPGCAA